MASDTTEASAEQAALRFALSRNYVSQPQLEEAARIREAALKRGQPAQLLAILATRYLQPAHAQEVQAVYHRELQQRQGPGGTVQLPPRAEASRPPSQRVAPPADPFQSGAQAQGRGGTRVDVDPKLLQSGATITVARSPSGTGAVEQVGGYTVVRELARGGMGVVYVCRKPGLERKVAVKVLLNADLAASEDLERFKIEADATSRLSHPGIVTVYDAGQDAGRPFIVMELVEGESLKAKLLREGPLPPKQAAALTRKLAQAMSYAHKLRVLHRDLKPSNVLLAADGEPKITDFGLAKDLRKSESGERGLTLTGDVMGTPAYMPPEQATGELDQIDRRADVYSLGATLYEMLTGRPPFEGSNPMRILSAVMVEDPTSPGLLRPGLDPDLETICLKCLEKRPGDRYRSMRALADDLDNFLGTRPIHARRATLMERLDKWLRRNRGVAVGISVALLVAGVAALGVAYYLGSMSAEQTRRAAQQALDRARQERVSELREQLQALKDQSGLGPALQGLQLASELQALSEGDDDVVFDAAVHLGEVSLAGQQFELARHAFQQAGRAHPAELDALLERVTKAESAQDDSNRDYVVQLLQDVAAGKVERNRIDLLLEVTSHPGRGTVTVALQQLQALAERLGATRDDYLRSMGELDAAARAQGLQPVPGAAAVVERELAREPQARATGWDDPQRMQQVIAFANAKAAADGQPSLGLLERVRRLQDQEVAKAGVDLLLTLSHVLRWLDMDDALRAQARATLIEVLDASWDLKLIGVLGESLERLGGDVDFARQVIAFLQQPEFEPGFGLRAPEPQEAPEAHLLERAQAAAKRGDVQGALDGFQAALAGGEDPYAVYFARARFRQGRREYPEAIQDYALAFQANPHSKGALMNASSCAKALGRYQQALDLTHQALEVDPNFVDAIFGEAMIYLDLASRAQGPQQKQAVEHAADSLRTFLQRCPPDHPFRQDAEEQLRRLGG